MTKNQNGQQFGKTESQDNGGLRQQSSRGQPALSDQKREMTKEEYEAGDSFQSTPGQQQRIPSSADWQKEPGSQRGEPTNSGDEMEDDIDEIGDDQEFDDDDIIYGDEDDESSDDLQNRRKQDNNSDFY